MTAERKTYLDILRILAILLVLFNHLPGYRLFLSEKGIAEAFDLMISTFTRVNVPVFAMISGALLLGRDETYHALWTKRISRILMVIPIFTIMLYLEFVLVKDKTFSLEELIRGIFAGNLKNFNSYWFLYAYLGFVLMLPFLRKISKSMKLSDFIMIMVLHIIFTTVVPLTNFTLLMCGQEKFTVSHSICVELSTATLLFYPLIGYYIDHRIDINKVTRKHINILLLTSLISIILTSLITYFYGEKKGYTQNYLDTFNYIPVITLFLLIKKMTTRTELTPIFIQVTSFLSSLAFGVYLLDNYLKLPLYDTLKTVFKPSLGLLGFSILWCSISFLLCGAITYLLKKLPVFRKIL